MLQRTVDAIDRAGFAVAWLACIAITVLVLLEIVSRPLGIPLYFTSEYSGFLMAWLVFFALARVTAERMHIAVDFLVGMLGPTVRLWLARVSAVLTLVYVAVLLWLAIELTMTSLADGLRSQGMTRTPLAIPQAGGAIGLAILLLRCAVAAYAATGRGDGDADREDDGGAR